MKLFDAIRRQDLDTAQYGEPEFRYLNRSARPEHIKIRQVMEGWFLHYPEAEQSELIQRFRSKNDSDFKSAFFELFMHEVLRRLGCQVQVHPAVRRNRPDFLVRCRNRERFYLETVLATGKSAQEAAAEARMNDVYRALEKLDSPDFFIGMRLRGFPATPPPQRRIINFLSRRLESIDPEQVDETIELHRSGRGKSPEWPPYEYDGWVIDFFPIRKPKSLRGKPSVRPMQLRTRELAFVDRSVAIQNAIVNKAGHYGKFDLPYVIAVNALDELVTETDIIKALEALFGKGRGEVEISPSGTPSDACWTGTSDGVWVSRSRTRYTRVSAVLVAAPVVPMNVPRAHICLYHNPWATRRYNCALTRLPQCLVEHGRLEHRDGESLGTIFGLPPNWPGQDHVENGTGSDEQAAQEGQGQGAGEAGAEGREATG